MNQHMKIHLFSLLPGERFRLAESPDSPIYSVVEGMGDNAAFLDEAGRPIASRAIAILNGGSMFVHAIPRGKGAGGS